MDRGYLDFERLYVLHQAVAFFVIRPSRTSMPVAFTRRRPLCQVIACAEHFRVMAFAQLTYRESLRDIEACLSAQASKLYHMGFREPIRRSTLSDANEARGWRIYADFAQVLIRQVRKLYAAESFGVEPSDRLRARLDHNRSVPVGFPVGAFSRHQGCREDAYAARSARCDPELHSRLGRKIARRQSSRPPFDALAIFWWCTGLIPNFLCDSLPRIIAPSRACAREGRRQTDLSVPFHHCLDHLRRRHVRIVMKRAVGRTWKQLARERLEDTTPTIPLGNRFWPPSGEEAQEIRQLFANDLVRRLVTYLHSRRRRRRGRAPRCRLLGERMQLVRPIEVRHTSRRRRRVCGRSRFVSDGYQGSCSGGCPASAKCRDAA